MEVLCGRDAELFGSENTAVTASKASLDLPQATYAEGRGSYKCLMRSGCTPRYCKATPKGQRYLDTILLFEAMGGDSQSWVVSNASSQP